MNITALDIHQKEFAHGMRGYREEEVDAFLDQLAVEVDATDKHVKELEEKIAALESRGANFEAERNTINNTLLTAQKAADEMLAKAQGECAETLASAQTQSEAQLEEARQQAERVVGDAQQKRHQLIGNFARLQGEEEKFRKSYLAQLDAFLFEIRQLEAEARTAFQEVVVPKHLKEELQDVQHEQPAPRGVSPVAAPPVAPAVAPAAPPKAAAEPAPAPAPAAERGKGKGKKPVKEDPIAVALSDSEFFGEDAASTFKDADEPTMEQAPVAPAPPAPAPAAPAAPAPAPAASVADQWGDMDDDLDIEEID